MHTMHQMLLPGCVNLGTMRTSSFQVCGGDFFQHSGSQREFEMFRVTMPVVLPLPSIDPPAWGFRTLACP